MHIGEPADDLALSSPTRLPVIARRVSQKVLLILLSGRMWVRDVDGQRREIAGPTWVVWYPGEALEYGTHGPTVHWVFAAPTGPVPSGSPRPGSSVRLAGDGGEVEEARLVHYLDDSPDRAGPLSVVADVAGSGIGIYALTDVVEVVEESDEDLHGWSYGPGLDHPLRLEQPQDW
ncbi:hypothetical protein QOZ88_11305 [Blastococcus sp. BMG 814]|uniref:DUF4178 domain-containing protein n=1 Tax=Blastococcus carthaginiensis TaxID=3050034 RepID=A0ABT9ICD2_9ACTN|nr:hypothetical protein [Blastococcus carthaginiensis]MDP5183226.1 hypothetical protein [Blastococcus carthaginiensis]